MDCFLETNFPLIQAFLNLSKNNFGEIHISQGLDWAFSLSVPLLSLEVAYCFKNESFIIQTHLLKNMNILSS